ncbi:protein phosphatase [Gracilibacillus halotolerans]|uniref:protein-serine/threonine phosphatase n=1 Tax=Gracilibacillus halotolerans TaxID=74386 RepID=A0A841RK99_9BACI|nr:Stp1/IreP family PP2C-type Ser/Thr phosphatase [Gracilibacillus halotolerans]MBB6511394.1 protein phosphatase [Gracilibacillus halotolerans]
MKFYVQTDVGKVRKVNEDAAAVAEKNESSLLAIVADGMGGHLAGDVASRLTVDSFMEEWKNWDNPELSKSEAEQWLKETLVKTNKIVYEKATKDEECAGMGTTVVAAICTNQFISIVHIGDSRAYIKTQQGFRQLTEDHSLVGELVRTGQLSEEDAHFHPRKNVILKAIGTDPVLVPDVFTLEWDENDSLLLCTDGLTNKISDDELHDSLLLNDLSDTPNHLIQLANDRGGEDNISVVVVHHLAGEDRNDVGR